MRSEHWNSFVFRLDSKVGVQALKRADLKHPNPNKLSILTHIWSHHSTQQNAESLDKLLPISCGRIFDYQLTKPLKFSI